jgi:predicted Zn-dependent peptidase
MSNIREDKGYTYGIQSALSSQGEEELFVISTQTANEYVEPLLAEVYKEMEVLKEELVPEGELTQVRNYVSGSALRVFDGSFLVVDYYVSLALRGVDISDYYSKKIKVVNSVTAEELREMARRYFNKKLFYEVVAGA